MLIVFSNTATSHWISAPRSWSSTPHCHSVTSGRQAFCQISQPPLPFARSWCQWTVSGSALWTPKALDRQLKTVDFVRSVALQQKALAEWASKRLTPGVPLFVLFIALSQIRQCSKNASKRCQTRWEATSCLSHPKATKQWLRRPLIGRFDFKGRRVDLNGTSGEYGHTTHRTSCVHNGVITNYLIGGIDPKHIVSRLGDPLSALLLKMHSCQAGVIISALAAIEYNGKPGQFTTERESISNLGWL